jgi:L-fuconolactonase
VIENRENTLGGKQLMLSMNRREFSRRLAAATCSAAATTITWPQSLSAEAPIHDLPIIDTHQHLWDLERLPVHWVERAKPVLRRSFVTKDYLVATRGQHVVKAVYMEVDVKPHLHRKEVQLVTELCKSPEHPTVAAVIGGRPNEPSFASYAREMAQNPFVRGVRQVLHGSETPKGFCLQQQFVRSMQLLGELGLSYDICLRPGELGDAVPLVDQCPDTRFIVDHCGNADPKAFTPAERPPNARPSHDPEQWKRDIAALADRPNVICKISGIVANAPQPDWTADHLAPIVNHCLDEFGPDRVVFGSDWPVCLMGAELADWIAALRHIIRQRPIEQQRKLLCDNAESFYRLA